MKIISLLEADAVRTQVLGFQTMFLNQGWDEVHIRKRDEEGVYTFDLEYKDCKRVFTCKFEGNTLVGWYGLAGRPHRTTKEVEETCISELLTAKVHYVFKKHQKSFYDKPENFRQVESENRYCIPYSAVKPLIDDDDCPLRVYNDNELWLNTSAPVIRNGPLRDANLRGKPGIFVAKFAEDDLWLCMASSAGNYVREWAKITID